MQSLDQWLEARGGVYDNYEEEEKKVKAHARRTDPDTSHAAARSITDVHISKLHTAIYAAFLAWTTMTDSTLCDMFPNNSPSSIRTRRKELVDKGHLRDSGMRFTNERGRREIVWEVAP